MRAALPHDPNQRVFLHGVSSKRLLDVTATGGDRSAVRLTYLAGELELGPETVRPPRPPRETTRPPPRRFWYPRFQCA